MFWAKLEKLVTKKVVKRAFILRGERRRRFLLTYLGCWIDSWFVGLGWCKRKWWTPGVSRGVGGRVGGAGHGGRAPQTKPSSRSHSRCDRWPWKNEKAKQKLISKIMKFVNNRYHIFPKGPTDLRQNGTQEKKLFSGSVFHALSHGMNRFVASVSFKNHQMEASHWLLEHLNQSQGGFWS